MYEAILAMNRSPAKAVRLSVAAVRGDTPGELSLTLFGGAFQAALTFAAGGNILGYASLPVEEAARKFEAGEIPGVPDGTR